MNQKLSTGKCDSTATDAKRLFDRKILAYAAAAGAAVVSGQAAQAVTVTRTINVDVFNGSYNLDVDNNGTTDFVFTNDGTTAGVSGSGGNEIVSHFSSNPLFFKEGLGPPGFTKASRLTTSNFVGASASFSNSPKLTGIFDSWTGESGYLGIKFEGGDTLTHYGFVQMSVDSDGSPTPEAIHIDTVSWDTVANERIHVAPAPAPEPVGLGALALGAAGLATLRRRRSA